MQFRANGNRNTQRGSMAAVLTLALVWSVVAGGHSPVAASDPVTAEEAPVRGAGSPVRLMIATINVDAAIESVGLTPAGAMDTPQVPDDTAWYQLGPRPGEEGNAVIAGHVDSRAGAAVFWDLRTLTPGSVIVIVSDDGVTHRFVMREAERYTRGSAPLARIFRATEGAHLTLITCDADTPFDRGNDAYGGHLIVYADAAP